MSKPIPLEYGKYYHIFSRGINRANLFFSERNYRFFMRRYAYYVEPVADTYAYCLLRNHFHVLARTRTVEEQEAWYDSQILRPTEPKRAFAPKNPSQQLGNLLNSYTKAINEAHGRTGSLFQHPFGRVEVTSVVYLRILVTYIHQNPQRHRLIDDFRAWPYSSYGAFQTTKRTRLKRDEVLDWFSGSVAFEMVHESPIDEATLAPLLLDDF